MASEIAPLRLRDLIVSALQGHDCDSESVVLHLLIKDLESRPQHELDEDSGILAKKKKGRRRTSAPPESPATTPVTSAGFSSPPAEPASSDANEAATLTLPFENLRIATKSVGKRHGPPQMGEIPLLLLDLDNLSSNSDSSQLRSLIDCPLRTLLAICKCTVGVIRRRVENESDWSELNSMQKAIVELYKCCPETSEMKASLFAHLGWGSRIRFRANQLHLKNGVVYLWTNLRNGKQYVGRAFSTTQTASSLYTRMEAHLQAAIGASSESCYALQHAIRCYGATDWDLRLVEPGPLEADGDVNLLEQFWVQLLGSKHPDGYNKDVSPFSGGVKSGLLPVLFDSSVPVAVAKFLQQRDAWRATAQGDMMAYLEELTAALKAASTRQLLVQRNWAR